MPPKRFKIVAPKVKPVPKRKTIKLTTFRGSIAKDNWKLLQRDVKGRFKKKPAVAKKLGNSAVPFRWQDHIADARDHDSFPPSIKYNRKKIKMTTFKPNIKFKIVKKK